MSKAWAGGSTRRWRKTRAHILARDQGLGCRAHREGWCDKVPGEHDCTDQQDTAHHTLGRSVTGDDPRYIVAACQPCNTHIGDPAQAPDPPGRAMTQW